MTDRSNLFPALACLALLVVAALAWHGFAHERDAAAADRARLATALERIDARLAAQATRLDQLEARPPAPSAASAITTTSAARLATTRAPAMTPEQARRQLEDRFIAEPLSPPWAARNETAVGTFLGARNLAALQLVAPRKYAVDCRSRTCRIELVFDDRDAGVPTQERLLMAIADSMPAAQTFTLPRPDGSTALVVFAGDREAVTPPP